MLSFTPQGQVLLLRHHYTGCFRFSRYPGSRLSSSRRSSGNLPTLASPWSARSNSEACVEVSSCGSRICLRYLTRPGRVRASSPKPRVRTAARRAAGPQGVGQPPWYLPATADGKGGGVAWGRTPAGNTTGPGDAAHHWTNLIPCRQARPGAAASTALPRTASHPPTETASLPLSKSRRAVVRQIGTLRPTLCAREPKGPAERSARARAATTCPTLLVLLPGEVAGVAVMCRAGFEPASQGPPHGAPTIGWGNSANSGSTLDGVYPIPLRPARGNEGRPFRHRHRMSYPYVPAKFMPHTPLASRRGRSHERGEGNSGGRI